MLLWGLVTIATSQVSSPEALYVARFLLGVAEAGFFPGGHPLPDLLVPDPAPWTDHLAVPDVWHLRRNDQRPLAAAIMLHLDGWMGLRDWQALFVVEGIPAVLLALVAYRFLDDSPAQAAWLSPTEKSLLASDLGKEVHAQQHGGIKALLKDPRIYVIGLTFFRSMPAPIPSRTGCPR
jgi:MFS family permease